MRDRFVLLPRQARVALLPDCLFLQLVTVTRIYKNMVNYLEHEVCCYNTKFRDYVIMIFNLDNVVCVRAGRRRNRGSIPGWEYNFFFQIVDIGSGARAMGTGSSSPHVK